MRLVVLCHEIKVTNEKGGTVMHGFVGELRLAGCGEAFGGWLVDSQKLARLVKASDSLASRTKASARLPQACWLSQKLLIDFHKLASPAKASARLPQAC
jgi:hypothetical protein